MKKLIVLTLAICFIAVASYSETFAGWDPAKAEQERKASKKERRQRRRLPSSKRKILVWRGFFMLMDMPCFPQSGQER